MWTLKNIKATNVASFKRLDLTPTQSVTTLVFGQNLDNAENQPSNGSGKSALIECIALAITGEPLRKVKIDEIIRDDADDMGVEATFYNNSTKNELVISRSFSRKSPQHIAISLDGKDIPQPTVADYNMCVLDLLGISKEDLFSYFILTESKYQPFFALPDKAKKETINGFSSADSVDQAINLVVVDKDDVSKELEKSYLDVERCKGAISALEESIKQTEENADNAARSKKEREAQLKNSIAEKRAMIREQKDRKQSEEKNIEILSAALDNVDVLEADEQAPLQTSYNSVLEIVEKHVPGSNIKDYNSISQSISNDLTKAQSSLADARKRLEEIQARIENGRKTISEQESVVASAKGEFDKVSDQCRKDMAAIRIKEEELYDKEQKIKDQITEANRVVGRIKNELSGVITCPNCRHRFLINSDVDVKKEEAEVYAKIKEVDSLNKDLNAARGDYDALDKQKNEVRQVKTEAFDKYDREEGTLSKYRAGLRSIENELSEIQRSINGFNDTISRCSSEFDKLRKKMFDEVYNVIEDKIDVHKRNIKLCDNNIATANGMIETYDTQLSALESQKDDHVVETMKKSLEDRKKELKQAEAKSSSVKSRYDIFCAQEQRFIRFKTTLANQKISALSQKINGVLERFGSDLRVNLGGYTVLKTGKVRDKISVEILRNGVSFGSYWKGSKGERTRLDVACIIAMIELVNANCQDDTKGLNLVVMDEILSGVDELGLVSIYEAINKMQMTTIVVSHTAIASNYSHTLTVTKENGISTINNNH